MGGVGTGVGVTGLATGSASGAALGASCATGAASGGWTAGDEGGVSLAAGAACVDTRCTSITGASIRIPAGGATCTSAITAACSASEIHTAASGRRSRGGSVGSSQEALMAVYARQGIYTPDGIAIRGTFGLRRKSGGLA